MDAQRLVARNVRRLRVKQQLSQEALAVDAGIGRAYVSALERGGKNPTLLLLERIAKALDEPISELFALPRPGEAAPKVLPKGRRKQR